MKNVCVLAAAVLFCSAVMAETAQVESRIESVGLFKNGLAVVRRVVETPGPGEFVIGDLPAPVHGSFFVQSVAPVTVLAEMKDVMVQPKAGEGLDLQGDLAGKEVTIHFRENTIPAVTGKVVALEDRERDSAWNRNYEQQSLNYRSAYYPPGMGGATPQRFIVMETADGLSYVENSMIAQVTVTGKQQLVRRRKPVMTMQVEGKGPQKIVITYLTKGIAWAPSYQLDLIDGTHLNLRQHAVIKNEMGDLKDVEILLISGYPSVEMAAVSSPMSLNTTLSQFFAQLSAPPGSRNIAMTQQVMLNSFQPAGEGADLGAIPAGEGVDLHYQSTGKRTLAEGAALSLEVARADAEYKPIVEWKIPDTRDAEGRYTQGTQDEAWDALIFKNPLGFPMTTAPAAVFSGGKFGGQRTSYWVNAGEETTLKVNKALSLRTRAIEQEEPGDRPIVHIFGRDYRQVAVKGELTMSNHRDQDVELYVRRQISGDLKSADGEPKTSLREEGVYSVNRRNELVWKMTLKPGEERKLSYRYSVLALN